MVITTPPMQPAPDELAERALSIRKVIRFINENPQTILCIAPEDRISNSVNSGNSLKEPVNLFSRYKNSWSG